MDKKVIIDWKFVASCGAVLLICKIKSDDLKNLIHHLIDASKECILANAKPLQSAAHN